MLPRLHTADPRAHGTQLYATFPDAGVVKVIDRASRTVVDSSGKVVPSSVVLLATPDGRLGRQWAGYVSALPWIPGRRQGQPVATRVIQTYYLESSSRVRVNNPRVTPGDPH